MHEIQNLSEIRGLPEWVLGQYDGHGPALSEERLTECLRHHGFSITPTNLKLLKAVSLLAMETRDREWLGPLCWEEDSPLRRIRACVRKPVFEWAERLLRRTLPRLPYASWIVIDLTVDPRRCRTELGRFLAENVSGNVPGDWGSRVALENSKGRRGYEAFPWPPMDSLDAARYFDRCAEAIVGSNHLLLDVAGAGVPKGWLRPAKRPLPESLTQAVRDGDEDSAQIFLWASANAARDLGVVVPNLADEALTAAAADNPTLVPLLIEEIRTMTNGSEVLRAESEHALAAAAACGNPVVVDALLDFVSDRSTAMRWTVVRLATNLENEEDTEFLGRWEQGLNGAHEMIFSLLLAKKEPITEAHIATARDVPNPAFAARLENLKAGQEAETLSHHLHGALPDPISTSGRQRL